MAFASLKNRSSPPFSPNDPTLLISATPITTARNDERRVNEKSLDGFKEAGGRNSLSGFSKKIKAFAWNRNDRKSTIGAPAAVLPSFVVLPISASTPLPVTGIISSAPTPTSTSLPMGFPAPPTASATPFARPHASTANFAPHSQRRSAQGRRFAIHSSTSSASTFDSATSFASTSIFNSSTVGDWESTTSSSVMSMGEAVSDHGSKEDARMKHPQWLRNHTLAGGITEEEEAEMNGLDNDERMWKVTGVASSPQLSSAASSSTSTRPLSSVISHDLFALLLADPATPPRAPVNRRNDDRQLSMIEEEEGGSVIDESPGGDADDEISPPRQRAPLPPVSVSGMGFADQAWASRTRIPSIRFEGLSMDQVFAEVEAKMAAEAEYPTSKRSTKRRSKVLSMYKPMNYGLPSSPHSSPKRSASSSSSLSSRASNPPPSPPTPSAFNAPPSPSRGSRSRTSPIRRGTFRPTPLNIDAANSSISRPRPTMTSFQGYASRASRDSTSIFSPRLDGSFTPVLSPTSPSSSTTTQASSPTSLGDAFTPTSATFSSSSLIPPPSPALSTTSSTNTARGVGVDLPIVFVLPPTPTLDEGIEWRRSEEEERTLNSRRTNVVIREEKRSVRVSSRASVAMGSRKAERKSTMLVEVESRKGGENVIDIRAPPLASYTTKPTKSVARPSSTAILSLHEFFTTTEPPTFIQSDIFPVLPKKHKHNKEKPKIVVAARRTNRVRESNGQDAFADMLSQLNRPHTPPVPSSSSSSSSSCSSAAPSPSTPPFAHATAFTAPLAEFGKRFPRSTSGGSESDDSRFGDANDLTSSPSQTPSTNQFRTSPTLPLFSHSSSRQIVALVEKSGMTTSESCDTISSYNDSEGGYESLDNAVITKGERISCLGFSVGMAM